MSCLKCETGKISDVSRTNCVQQCSTCAECQSENSFILTNQVTGETLN